MTWITTWPTGNSQIPQYAEHPTEAAAEAHAAELVRSKRAHYAVAFWASGVAA